MEGPVVNVRGVVNVGGVASVRGVGPVAAFKTLDVVKVAHTAKEVASAHISWTLASDSLTCLFLSL